MEMQVADTPPSLNKVLRMHWIKRQALQQAWAWMVRIAWGHPPAVCQGKRKVTITLYHSRLYDTDNLWGSVKPVVDALRFNKLIFDDTPEYLDLTVRQEKCSHRDRHTIIELV